MAKVTIEYINDPIFKLLGALLETSEFDALGRMVHIWDYCIESNTQFVKDTILAAITGREEFGEYLVRLGLAEHSDGGVVIGGAKWLE